MAIIIASSLNSPLASAIVVRAAEDSAGADLSHDGNVRFLYVLRGSALLDCEGRHALSAGDACAIPPHVAAKLEDVAPDFKILEVCDPSQSPG